MGAFMQNFRTYQLSLSFYRRVQNTKLPAYLKDQLLRAASSICLTLAEGSGKRTRADQNRFFYMALGSAREVQAIFDIERGSFSLGQRDQLDHIAASIYKLTRWQG
jgi:four helix bundle protein